MLKKKADLILVLFLIAIAGLIFLITHISNDNAKYVVVRVNGNTVGSYDLNKDGTFVLNNGTNTLVIENKKAYLIQADCPDKLCIKQGKIKLTGQCITCLPNKLTVTLEGKNKEADFIL